MCVCSQHENVTQLHIEKTRTTPYHPQSDGLVERVNRTLESMLVTCVKEHSFHCVKHLKKVVLIITPSFNPLLDFHNITSVLAGKQKATSMLVKKWQTSTTTGR